MRFVYIFTYLYLLLRPYYLFKSGSLQISDFFLIGAFFLLLLISKRKKNISNIIKENKHFMFFVAFVFVINLIYFLIYSDQKFLLSTLYIIFNMLSIIVFSCCMKEEKFLVNTKKIFQINMVLQLIFNFFNIGRMYGTIRYMGTFNDPNQFGYYILLSFMFIYLINMKLNDKHKKLQNILFFIIGLYLIIQSASTGMLLGYFSFLLFLMIFNIKNIFQYIYKNFKKIFLIFIFGGLLSFSIFFTNIPNILLKSDTDLVIIDRIIAKFDKMDNDTEGTNAPGLLEERGYDRILKHPYVIFYGSGEGVYGRYESYHDDEIHATLPSILFYYGIIPTLFIIIWMKKKIKGIPLSALAVYFAIIIESFTLLNQRQVLFWILFVLADFLKLQKENKEK